MTQQSDAALARLQVWSKGYFQSELKTSNGLSFLVLENVKPKSTARIVVWDRPWKHGSPPTEDKRYLCIGTEDKPATLAEMIDAALSRWAELYGENP